MIRRIVLLLAAGWIGGCAAPAVVMVSRDYDPKAVGRIALIGFTDYPGMPGSGLIAAGAFEKYLLLGDYRLVERRKVEAVVQEQLLQTSGDIDPATARKLGALLGVDALAFGTLSDYSSPRDRTVMVDLPQEHSEPIYGRVETVQRTGDTTVKTVHEVVTGYSFRQVDQIVPQIETTPAHVGMSVRLVSVQTGEVLWIGSGASSGPDLHTATEEASAQIMQAVAKKLKKR